MNRLSALSPKQRIAGIAGVIVIIGAVVGVVIATTSNNKPQSTALHPTGPAKLKPVSVTTTTGLTVPAGNCPLTDVHAPSGVPDRPALAIKIGNEPEGARPQSGLNEADIVFDTPAEGYIMRYEAVYQCTDAAQVGPNRSIRWVDWRLVRQMAHPLIAFAGGIDPNVNQVMKFKWAQADNLLGNAAQDGIRTTNRVPPDNLFTSTSKLYAMSPAFVKKYGPPPPIFRYSAAPPAGSTPAAAVHINFSYDTDVTWTWNATLGEWLHSYSDGPDIDTLTNTQVSTTNVVILVVKYKFGPHIESKGGSGDFESQTTGSGTGYILRNGRSIKVTWQRRFVTEPWTFTSASGAKVALSPGRTWVELLPNTTAAAKGAFSITP